MGSRNQVLGYKKVTDILVTLLLHSKKLETGPTKIKRSFSGLQQ